MTKKNNESVIGERRWRWKGIVACLVFVTAAGLAVVYAGNSSEKKTPFRANEIPYNVGIEQKPNAQVPLDVHLRDETGRDVRLGDICVGKPVILALVYYQCPMLCNMTMDGLVRSLTELSLNAGDDYTVLTVSFDPREDFKLAAAARKTALTRYGRSGAERGWRFLTGEESEIRRLTDAVGFHYRYDAGIGQFAHAAGLFVLTPAGKVSRYLAGVTFLPRDLRLALVEASQGVIGTSTDQVLLLCFHYDPTTGKYGLAIMNVLRLAGAATVIGLGTAIFVMMRRERQRNATGKTVGASDM